MNYNSRKGDLLFRNNNKIFTINFRMARSICKFYFPCRLIEREFNPYLLLHDVCNEDYTYHITLIILVPLDV